ncbi:MAG: hypothetical protein HQK58_09075 [Deltaproteobacteria bacterium]|nr:hypothetical protein [Deltaproteobacteria bacterium]
MFHSSGHNLARELSGSRDDAEALDEQVEDKRRSERIFGILRPLWVIILFFREIVR